VGLGILNRIGKVIDHNIDKFIELVLETRKDFNQKALLYNSSGEDSPPAKNDRIILLHIDGTGKYIAAGVLTESQGAKPGEKIFFSRNADGEIQSIIKMLEDGNVIGEIKKDFTLTVTGKTTETFKDTVSKTFEKTVENTHKDNVTEDATGKDYNIKAKTVKIEGAVEIILMTVGSSAWFPNCIPFCPFGIPHGGHPGGIIGLKGA
jgi:hypothetical protein